MSLLIVRQTPSFSNLGEGKWKTHLRPVHYKSEASPKGLSEEHGNEGWKWGILVPPTPELCLSHQGLRKPLEHHAPRIQGRKSFIRDENGPARGNLVSLSHKRERRKVWAQTKEQTKAGCICLGQEA